MHGGWALNSQLGYVFVFTSSTEAVARAATTGRGVKVALAMETRETGRDWMREAIILEMFARQSLGRDRGAQKVESESELLTLLLALWSLSRR